MSCSLKRKIYCLMGPTAVGKSAVALALAKSLPLEIISVDSVMVYRGMDIGTAKPTHAQLQEVTHHLIDICDPGEAYSVGQFRHDALQKIEEIFARGRIPLLVGGTMLYFHVLQSGLAQLPTANAELRAKIQAQMLSHGPEALYAQLQIFDPKTAEQINCNDSQRIQRALEVYALTGKGLRDLQLGAAKDVLPYEVINLVIVPQDLSSLRPNISRRIYEMLDLGLVAEVQRLYKRGDLHRDLPALRAVGYNQVWQYLAGQISYEKMLELIPIATGQLAKHQLTWLKKWQNAARFMYDDPQLVTKIAAYFTVSYKAIQNTDSTN